MMNYLKASLISKFINDMKTDCDLVKVDWSPNVALVQCAHPMSTQLKTNASGKSNVMIKILNAFHNN